eukprot:3301825-Amphidinium_carterae.4
MTLSARVLCARHCDSRAMHRATGLAKRFKAFGACFWGRSLWSPIFVMLHFTVVALSNVLSSEYWWISSCQASHIRTVSGSSLLPEVSVWIESGNHTPALQYQ